MASLYKAINSGEIEFRQGPFFRLYIRNGHLSPRGSIAMGGTGAWKGLGAEDVIQQG